MKHYYESKMHYQTTSFTAVLFKRRLSLLNAKSLVRRHIPSCSWAIFVDFCARIRMGPEKVENVDSLTFKKAKNHKFTSRKLISQYGFGHKMG